MLDAGGSPPGVARYSTLPLPAAQRRAYWGDVVARTFPGMTVDAEDGIRADLASARVGAVMMALARSQRSRVHRTAAADERNLVLHLQQRGRLSLLQGPHEAIASAGSIAVADDGMAYSIDISDRNDCLVVHVPISLVDDAEALDWRARLLDGRDPNVAMLARMIVALWEEGRGGALDPALANAVGMMVRVAAGHPPAPGSADVSPVAFALRHLSDPDLSTDTIAVALGLSPRGVQKAFLREVGRTPTAFIADRRLARAAELLSARAGQSVTEIAFAVGFCDSSHFARAFRQRYRLSPSRWTAAAA